MLLSLEEPLVRLRVIVPRNCTGVRPSPAYACPLLTTARAGVGEGKGNWKWKWKKL